ncbi:MAG TPA: acyl-CoA carboxylase subunit beta [Deltaproteobacteria bacterium]|nr:acyl-CoA carboxylase subunit beta [Deltaproteobacteria bacterium]
MDERYKKRIERLREVKKTCLQGGGEDKILKVHAAGRMTARERVDYLLDDNSFVEHNLLIGHDQGLAADGIVAGYGTIHGRPVCLYSQDATVKGGSIGGMHGFKMYRTIEWALDMRVPFIGLNDSPGARIPDMNARSVFGDAIEKHGGAIFYPNTQASGVVPQISAIMGSCAGISVYSPALTDFIFMVDKQSHMFITGPGIVNVVMGEQVSKEDLGGAEVHCRISGVADGRYDTEQDLLDGIRQLMTYLPQNSDEHPPLYDLQDDPQRFCDELTEIVPASSSRAYDIRKAIFCIVDAGDFFEIKPEFAPEMVVGFARLDGRVVGIVANQPSCLAGSLTVDSSDKQTRFMRFCDCFNIPIILLVDTSAYLPGRDQEHKGIIRHGAKVLYALCESSVPRIGLVMRKAYGGGNLGMGVIPAQSGTDMLFYWPTTELGVMGAKASVELFFGEMIRSAPDPEKMRQQLLLEYEERYANPMREAGSNPFINDVIEPRETRRVLIRSLNFLATKKTLPRYPKRHGNIPM